MNRAAAHRKGNTMLIETPETVTLKNGACEKKLLVAYIFNSLNMLMIQNPAAFCGLVSKARDSEYKMSDSTKALLQKFDLIHDGGVHDCVKHVIESSVEGKAHMVRLVPPLKI